MAPAYAVPRMLARNGLTLQDFDLYEIHEAFAAQVLCTLEAWEDPVFCKRAARPRRAARLDRPREAQRQRRSLAAGHPFAATGGRIVASLAKLLARARRGPRPDLDLRRRRPGRRRDPREGRECDAAGPLQPARQQPDRRVDRRSRRAPAAGRARPLRAGSAGDRRRGPARRGARRPARRRGRGGPRRRRRRSARPSFATRFATPWATRASTRRSGIRRLRPTQRFKALVFDATGIADSTELGALREFFQPTIRRVEPSGRVIVLGTPPEACGNPRGGDRPARAGGLQRARSARRCAAAPSAQLVYVAPGAEGSVESTLRFLLSPRSAYVSGQVVRIGDAVADAAGVDWERRSTAGSRWSPEPPAGSARRSPGSSRATARTWWASTCRRRPTDSQPSPARSAALRWRSTSRRVTRLRGSPTTCSPSTRASTSWFTTPA